MTLEMGREHGEYWESALKKFAFSLSTPQVYTMARELGHFLIKPSVSALSPDFLISFSLSVRAEHPFISSETTPCSNMSQEAKSSFDFTRNLNRKCLMPLFEGWFL